MENIANKENCHSKSSPTVTNGNRNQDNYNCNETSEKLPQQPQESLNQQSNDFGDGNNNDNENGQKPVDSDQTTINNNSSINNNPNTRNRMLAENDQSKNDDEDGKLEIFDQSSLFLTPKALKMSNNGSATTKNNDFGKNPTSSNDSSNLHLNNRHHHNHHHQLIRQQTSSSSSATVTPTTTFNNFKKSPRKKNKKTQTYQRPPDGGWGWMVVLASFVISFIADGVSLSFGVIYVELVSYFQESKSKTAWVGSLFLSIPLLTGPIASGLVDEFGCRKVTIAGSLLASAGFFFGYFATCLEHLFFAFSLSGFGLALCYVTSIVSVAYWFDKRRSLATGLAVCGTGFGTFLFAPFIIFLLEKFDWRGTLLILSGVFLNMICCGFLIRDLDIDSFSSSSSSSNIDDTSDLDSTMDSANEADDIEFDEQHHRTSSPLGEERHRLLRSMTRQRMLSETEQHDESFPRHTASMINIPTFIKNNIDNNKDGNPINGNSNKNPTKVIFEELTFRRGGYLHNLICHYPHLLSMFLPGDIQCDDLTVKTKSKFDNNPKAVIAAESPPPVKNSQRVVEFGSIHHMDSNLKLNINGSLLLPSNDELQDYNKASARHSSTTSKFGLLLNFARQSNCNAQQQQLPTQSNDLINRGNRLHNLRLPRGSLTYRSAMLVMNKYRLKASSAPDIYRTSMVTINEEKGSAWWHCIKNIYKSMTDISNFKSVRYSIFCLSNFLLYACVDVPYVYIPDLVITSGASTKEAASKFISIIGVFNTLGLVFVGYIGDKKWLDVSYIYATLICISGVSIGTIPLTTLNYVIVIQTAIYGFCISANYSLVSVILVELISLDSFTTAYGMLLLIQGIGSLVGPPLAGWVYDELQNYDAAFYITGIVMVLSGLLVIPVGNKQNCFLWKPSTSEENTSVLGISYSDAGSSSPTITNKTKNSHHHQSKLNGILPSSLTTTTVGEKMDSKI